MKNKDMEEAKQRLEALAQVNGARKSHLSNKDKQLLLEEARKILKEKQGYVSPLNRFRRDD